jgi:hypothetical protein
VACQIIWQLVNDRLERIMEGISHALIWGTILTFAWMNWGNLHCWTFVYRALLPSYRPAPDYETAMQQKYRGTGHTSGNLNMRPSHQIGILYSSQPEIHQTHIQEVSWELVTVKITTFWDVIPWSLVKQSFLQHVYNDVNDYMASC